MKKKTQKIIVFLLILLITVLLFGACSLNTEKKQIAREEVSQCNIIRILSAKNSSSLDDNIRIYVDKDTKVMYLFVFSGDKGGLSVMYEADGKPKIWDGDFKELE